MNNVMYTHVKMISELFTIYSFLLEGQKHIMRVYTPVYMNVTWLSCFTTWTCVTQCSWTTTVVLYSHSHPVRYTGSTHMSCMQSY